MAVAQNNLNALETIRRRGDVAMLAVTWLYVFISFGLATMHNTWILAITIAVPIGIVATVVAKMKPGSLFTSATFATAFMCLVALHIHQGHGMVELHFSIFVLLAFLQFYRHWVPIVVGAAVTAVHHILFNILQEAGMGVYIFEMRPGWGMVATHAIFVVFEAAVLIYLAKQSKDEATTIDEIRSVASNGEVINLGFRVTESGSEFARSFNNFVGAIHSVVEKTIQAADKIGHTANELSQNSKNSEENILQQELGTKQVAEAVSQMAETTQEVTRNANIASEAANTAKANVLTGSKALEQSLQVTNIMADEINRTTDTVKQLEEESQNIGQVLEVIRGIAEQTNLLALNAAIEAARAGDQGRGFAVVADEVRTLASRTQESTEEIQNMIAKLQEGAINASTAMDSSRNQVNEANEKIISVDAALQEITDAIVNITDINTQIAATMEEQSAISEEITGSVNSIWDQAQNTALEHKKTVAASIELEKLGTTMRDLTKCFAL